MSTIRAPKREIFTKEINVIFRPNLSAKVKRALVYVFIMLSLGCASTPPSDTEEQVANANVDKFESFNRTMFKFNDVMDRWLLKPVAKGYSKVLPGPVKTGVGNFFSNLGEVSNIINDGLQWKWKQASNDSGRLLLNSTFGLLGVFDVASKAGLEKNDGENFGQTLSAWGVPRGSYVVLPFLGPNTVRGSFSIPVDWATSPIQYLESTNARIGANAVDFVHTRYELLDAEDLISGDRYLFVREAYLQRLEYLEQDGNVVDDFGDGFGDDEYGDGF